MKSRWIINLLLLLAIVILGLIAHFEPGIEAPVESPAITSLTPDQVHRIHINRPIREDLVLSRQTSADWQLERTPPLPADSLKVRALTRLVGQLPVRSYAATNLDLGALQLDPPYASAIFNDVAIEFGNLEPIDDLRYVRVAEKIHLIPDNYLQLMETGYSQFVRQRLFAEGARIESIRLPDFSVSQAEGAWRTIPEQDVDNETLQQFVDAWQAATALYVQTADTGVSGDNIEVTLRDNGTPLQFVIVSREPDFILARPDYGIQYRMGALGVGLLSADSAAADTEEPPEAP